MLLVLPPLIDGAAWTVTFVGVVVPNRGTYLAICNEPCHPLQCLKPASPCGNSGHCVYDAWHFVLVSVFQYEPEPPLQLADHAPTGAAHAFACALIPHSYGGWQTSAGDIAHVPKDLRPSLYPSDASSPHPLSRMQAREFLLDSLECEDPDGCHDGMPPLDREGVVEENDVVLR